MPATKHKDKKHPRKSKKRKEKKPSKYDEKIIVDASFDELIKELITPEKK